MQEHGSCRVVCLSRNRNKSWEIVYLFCLRSHTWIWANLFATFIWCQQILWIRIKFRTENSILIAWRQLIEQITRVSYVMNHAQNSISTSTKEKGNFGCRNLVDKVSNSIGGWLQSPSRFEFYSFFFQISRTKIRNENHKYPSWTLNEKEKPSTCI